MDNSLFSSDTDDSEYDNIEESYTQFWEKINVHKYDLQIDLQKCAFLIDLLQDLYKFKLDNNEIIIFEKKNKSIEVKVDKEKIVYFLHIELVSLFKEAGYNLYHNNGKNVYNSLNYFKDVETIYKTINNMKIYLMYNKIIQEEKKVNKDLLNTEKNFTNKEISKNLKLLSPKVL